MRTILFVFGLIPFFLFARPIAAAPANTNSTYRLTIELRDGSRVVGTSTHERLNFHSTLLGDLKLAVKDIRSIDCVSSNSAKLLTAGGDTLTIWFADSAVIVKTSFGKIELAADSIRKITVSGSSSTSARHPGLIALWSGEDNGKDSIGSNDAELTDMSFADGQVGRAFSLNGYSSWMKIPGSENLDVGKGGGVTISAWIKPSDVMGFHPILEWEITKAKNSVSLWIGHLPQDRGVLLCNFAENNPPNNHMLLSTQGAVRENQFQHVAMTYDKTTGMGRLFLNGRVVAEENLGIFTPSTTGPLFISRRPADQPGDWTYNTFFGGLMDEVAIYNRALSPEEIQTIAQEDNHGEPLPPPATSRTMPFRQNFNGIMDYSN